MKAAKVLHPASPISSDTASPAALSRLIPLWLILAVLAAFWPLLTSDFTRWDDELTIAHNAWLNPPTLQSFATFWNPISQDPQHGGRIFMDIYIPLTYSLWAGVARLSYVSVPDPETGAFLNPLVFHLVNILVHCVSVLIVFAILKRLIARPWAAAVGAALFALHPVQVEPVAWISGLKDVLAGCLSLLAVWQYIEFAETSPSANPSNGSKRWVHYGASLTAFALAMLAKPSAVATPLLIVVIDMLFLRRPIRKVIASILPFLALCIPIVLEGRHAQSAQELGYITPIHLRPLIAADALAFYLYKLFFPIWHCIIYNRRPDSALHQGWPSYTWIVPAGVAIAAWIFRKRLPWLATAVGVYWAAVIPVLGLVPFDFQDHSTVADHYLYVAMLGPAIAGAFLMARFANRTNGVICILVLAALGARSFAQTWTWKNSWTLYRHAIAINPHAWAARKELGLLYLDSNHPAEALEQLRMAEADAPSSRNDQGAEHEAVGDALTALKRFSEALNEYEAAERIAPGNAVIRRKIAQSRARLSGTQ